MILSGSGDAMSARRTAPIIFKVLSILLGHPPSEELFDWTHFLFRKTGHVTVYAILGYLVWRAIRAERTTWNWHWAVAAVVIAGLVAVIDESHQAMVPSRTGTPVDIALDTVAAALAQFVMWFELRRRRTK